MKLLQFTPEQSLQLSLQLNLKLSQNQAFQQAFASFRTHQSKRELIKHRIEEFLFQLRTSDTIVVDTRSPIDRDILLKCLHSSSQTVMHSCISQVEKTFGQISSNEDIYE